MSKREREREREMEKEWEMGEDSGQTTKQDLCMGSN